MSDKCCKNATCNNSQDFGACRFCKASCAGCEHAPKIEEFDLMGFLDEMRSVTPGELSARYGKGDDTILIDNVYVVFGLPEPLVKLILKLLREKKLYISPCAMGVMDWMISGSPIPRKMKMASGKYDWSLYKTERWYPCEIMTKKWFTYRVNHLKTSQQEKDSLLRSAGIRRS